MRTSTPTSCVGVAAFGGFECWVDFHSALLLLGSDVLYDLWLWHNQDRGYHGLEDVERQLQGEYSGHQIGSRRRSSPAALLLYHRESQYTCKTEKK